MHNSHSCLTILFSLLFAIVTYANEPQAVDSPRTLTVGDKAPSLSIAHWLHDKHGQLEPIETYEPGTVYVIEFWGTTCYPCVVMMPHMAQLQKQYGHRALRIVSVSTEELGEIQKFLERDAPGTDGQTYDALTKGYSLASDPDRSTYEDYMTASGVFGIPAAFIVGKSGLIEWIGNPGTMDKPLLAIMGDKWNLETFKVEFQRRQLVLSAVRKISILRQMRHNEPEIVLAEIDKEMNKLKGVAIPDVQLLRLMRIRLLIKSNRFDDAQDEVDNALMACGDDLESVFLAALGILQLPQSDQIDVKRLVAIAIERIRTAKNSTSLDKWTASVRDLTEAKAGMLVAQLYAKAGQIQEARIAAKEAMKAAPEAGAKKKAQALYERLGEMLPQQDDRVEELQNEEN